MCEKDFSIKNEENSLFKKIAKELLSKSLLCVTTPFPLSSLSEENFQMSSEEYRILEIEFYLYSSSHRDEFTHCHFMQSSFNKRGIYFHRASKKNESKYKNGTFKGMDLVFSEVEDEYFGVLIRSIYSISRSEKIIGPCCVVNEILSSTKCSSIRELLPENEKISFEEENSPITLKKSSSSNEIFSFSEHKIKRGPRIGLKCNPEKGKSEEWVEAPLRYALDVVGIPQRKRMDFVVFE